MSLIKVIPKLFYAEIQTGLDFFVNGLAFKLGYYDETLAIVERDGVILSVSPDHHFSKNPTFE